jgi:hypothetical protein
MLVMPVNNIKEHVMFVNVLKTPEILCQTLLKTAQLPNSI